jgi:ubiquinone/menaquinone biosynthesis C-methylase UbiE
MGFEKGVKEWRRFLKPGGTLVVSEITWLTNTRPPGLQQYWDGEYAEINTASAKIEVLEKSGYAPMAYFVLPESCWLENYYRPLQDQFPDFIARHEDDARAASLIAAEEQEIALYEQYKPYYGYGMYIARRVG